MEDITIFDMANRGDLPVEGADTLDSAMEMTGFGRYQLMMIMVCGLAYSTVSLVSSAMSYDAVAIGCEFNLSPNEKKTINYITYSGMICGTVLWSVLGDVICRRPPMIAALLINMASVVGMAASRGVLAFSICKFVSSASTSGISMLAIVILAEFQTPRNRGSALSCLQVFWLLGTVFLPALGLPWRVKVGLGAVLPLLCAARLYFASESPHLLLARKRFQKTIRCLQNMFNVNTGLNTSRYPVRNLKTKDGIQEDSSVFPEYIQESVNPPCYCMPIVLAACFMLHFGYYALGMWFSDLTGRHEFLFSLIRRGHIALRDCDMESYDPENIVNRTFPPSGMCTEEEQDSHAHPFMCMLLIGFSRLMAAVCLVISIDTLGRKFFLPVSHVIAATLVFCSYFSNTSPQDIVFACIFEAACTLSVACYHCLAVEFSSTQRRCITVGLVIGISQLGAVMGHHVLTTRLHAMCLFLLPILSVCIAATGLLSIILPDTDGMSLR